MTQPDASESTTQSVPTVQTFETKLRSVWTAPLPHDGPLVDLSQLDEILAEHQKWVESLENPQAPVAGRRAVLKNQDLRGVNLSKRDLRGADFSGANLEGARLDHCLLTLTNLAGANLRNADLRGARIKRADLTGANLEGAELSPADRS